MIDTKEMYGRMVRYYVWQIYALVLMKLRPSESWRWFPHSISTFMPLKSVLTSNGCVGLATSFDWRNLEEVEEENNLFWVGNIMLQYMRHTRKNTDEWLIADLDGFADWQIMLEVFKACKIGYMIDMKEMYGRIVRSYVWQIFALVLMKEFNNDLHKLLNDMNV